MPVDDVAALLRRWNASGGVRNRARVLADGSRLLGSLTPLERRLVARALVDEGAPDLSERIGTATGHAVSPGDLQEVADQLLSLDRDRVDLLATRLEDPVQRRALAAEVMRAAGDAVAAGPALPDGDGDEAGPPPLPPPPPSAVAPPDEAGPDIDPSAEPEPAEPEPDRTPALVLEADPVEGGVQPTDVTDGGHVTAEPPATPNGPDTSVLEGIERVQDGWKRRRAVTALVWSGRLDPSLSVEVLRRLGRDLDRTFAAGAMLDVGLLDPDDLADLLPERSARRLAARIVPRD